MFHLFDLFRKLPQQDAWSASAYLYEDMLIINANNRTQSGTGWNSEPVVTLSLDAKPTAFGELIRSTVLASRWNAERPSPLGPDAPVVQAAGVKSWTVLERKALLIHIELRDSTFTVIPNRATVHGEGRGWTSLDEHLTLPESCSDAELGDVIVRAFEMCIPWEAKH